MTEQIKFNTFSQHALRDFAHAAFGLTDAAATFWRPMLNGVGRCQLELATLSARNVQSCMKWQRAVSSTFDPSQMLAANMTLWSDLVGSISESGPRVTTAMAQVAEPVSPFNVLQFSEPRRNDEIAPVRHTASSELPLADTRIDRAA